MNELKMDQEATVTEKDVAAALGRFLGANHTVMEFNEDNPEQVRSLRLHMSEYAKNAAEKN